MSNKLGTLILVGMGFTNPVLAETALRREVITRPIITRPDIINPVREPVISGKFQVLSPENGKAIPGSTILQLPNGKTMSADSYYSELNKYEDYLNDKGASLKSDQDELGVVERAPSTAKLLNDQRLLMQNSNEAPQMILDAKLMEAFVRPKLITGIIINPLPIDPECTSAEKASYSKLWQKTLGNSTFNVGVQSQVNLQASCSEMKAKATGKAFGEVFDNGFDFLRAEFEGRATDSDGSDLSAQLYLSKWKIFDHSSHYDTTIDENAHRSKSFDLGGSFHFAVGPIPVKISYGVEGSVGVHYSYHLSPLKAKALVRPYTDVDAYVRGGIDAVIAGGGVSGELELLELSLRALGESSFRVANQRPYIYLNAMLDYQLEALDGEFSAYVYVYVPRWGIPPWKKKTYSTVITSWNGFDMQGTIAEYTRWVSL